MKIFKRGAGGGIHKKGWGQEVWIENLQYCGKILEFEGGKSGSMHFHMKKEETMYLQSGNMEITMIDPEVGQEYIVTLQPGESIHIPPGQMHQLHAVIESRLFEFSTHHEDSDSYRVWKGD